MPFGWLWQANLTMDEVVKCVFEIAQLVFWWYNDRDFFGGKLSEGNKNEFFFKLHEFMVMSLSHCTECRAL